MHVLHVLHRAVEFTPCCCYAHRTGWQSVQMAHLGAITAAAAWAAEDDCQAVTEGRADLHGQQGTTVQRASVSLSTSWGHLAVAKLSCNKCRACMLYGFLMLQL